MYINMNRDKNLKTLKGIIKYAQVDIRSKINDIVELYKSNTIPNFITAKQAIIDLASTNKNTIKAGLRKYDKIAKKYAPELLIYRLKQGDHAKPNSYVQYIFKDSYIQPNEEGLETRGIDEIFKDIRQNLVEDLKKALVNKSTSKIRMRLEVEMFKRIMGFDGDCEEQIIKYNISSNPSKLTKTNLESTLEKLKIEIVNKFEKIDDKMPSSGWRLRRYIHLGVDIFETRPVRGSSYIPTPEKYGNSRTGLINIKNNDQECFRWCMKYH